MQMEDSMRVSASKEPSGWRVLSPRMGQLSEGSPSTKSFLAKMIQKSSNADPCDAPDLIPDDIFYMNFNCTNVLKKNDGVDSCTNSPLSKAKSS